MRMHQNVAFPTIKFQNFLVRVCAAESVPLHFLMVPLKFSVAGDAAGSGRFGLGRITKFPPDRHGSGCVGSTVQNIFKMCNLYMVFNKPANSLSIHGIYLIYIKL